MKLEEIEKVYEDIQMHSSDCEEADLARTLVPKLIAIAKAAKLACEDLKYKDFVITNTTLPLEQALKELEKI